MFALLEGGGFWIDRSHGTLHKTHFTLCRPITHLWNAVEMGGVNCSECAPPTLDLLLASESFG